MRLLRKLAAPLLAVLFAASSIAPASADVVTWPYGINPPSSWLNMIGLDAQEALGVELSATLGTASNFWNLCTSAAASGLFVTVAPCSESTWGAVWQYSSELPNPIGGPGSTAIPADATLNTMLGMTNTTSTSIPVPAPATSGQSIKYLIEAQVVPTATTTQSVNYVSSSGAVTPGTATRDLKNLIVYQAKAGTASTTPTAPSADSGWLGLSVVTVAYGATSVTASNVANNAGFLGVPLSNASNTFTSPQTFSAGLSTPFVDFTGGTGTPSIGNDAAAVSGLNFAAPSSCTYCYRFFVGTVEQSSPFGATPGPVAEIDASGDGLFKGQVVAPVLSMGGSLSSLPAVGVDGTTSTAGLQGVNIGVNSLSEYGLRGIAWPNGVTSGAFVTMFDAYPNGNFAIAGTVSATGTNFGSRREWKYNIRPLDPKRALAIAMRAGRSVASFCYRAHREANGFQILRESCPKGITLHTTAMANGTPSIISGPNHDHYDPGAASAVALAAELELQREIVFLRSLIYRHFHVHAHAHHATKRHAKHLHRG